ncbi:hypothetical protein QTH49_13180 [Clostridium perfringens]|nr:hypothetical protein [Clostridium perfringens]
MIKVRITFVDNNKRKEELEKALNILKSNHEIINKSNVYKGRNGSKYSNICLDIEADL